MGIEKKFGEISFEISNTQKIFYPEAGYTKGDLIEYYEKIAEITVPLIQNRPITMVRFPNGIDGKRFFQKGTPDYFPKWIKTRKIKKQEGGDTKYVVCNNQATLVYLANQACITPHIWLSRIDKLDYPDKLIIDLDPEVDDFSKVKAAAVTVKELLNKRLGLPVFLMTTGSRGLHVVVPLKRTKDFDKVRDFAQKAAKFLEEENKEVYTTAARKNKREGKIYLDVGRNAFAQTGVAPYAVRSIEGAPVATPLFWEELEEDSLSPRSYNIKNVLQKLEEKGDPWKDFTRSSVTITSAEKKLNKIIGKKQSKK